MSKLLILSIISMLNMSANIHGPDSMQDRSPSMAKLSIQNDSTSRHVKVTESNLKPGSSLVDILSSPFFTALIGLLGTGLGFWISNYSSRNNQLENEKQMFSGEISRKLSLYQTYKEDHFGQQVWTEFHDECTRKLVATVGEGIRLKHLERKYELSDHIKQIEADLYDLYNRFEHRIMKKEEQEFQTLVNSFFQSFDYEKLEVTMRDSKYLQELRPEVHIQDQTDAKRPEQLNALNALVLYMDKKIKE
jgi:hypothetical protein